MYRAVTEPENATLAGKFVEVLTAEMSGEAIGYCFGGGRPGPNALVAGDRRLMNALFERLNTLPTLPWMWGRLYLGTTENIERVGLKDIKNGLANLHFDGLVMLPYLAGAKTHAISVDRAYWGTLRLCRNLGMIVGRGVTDKIETEKTPM